VSGETVALEAGTRELTESSFGVWLNSGAEIGSEMDSFCLLLELSSVDTAGSSCGGFSDGEVLRSQEIKKWSDRTGSRWNSLMIPPQTNGNDGSG